MKYTICFSFLVCLICIHIDDAYGNGGVTKSGDSESSNVLMEDMKHCKSMMLYMFGYGAELEYCNWDQDRGEKLYVLDGISCVAGDATQTMRIMCWVIEHDPVVRVELLKQWLSQMKYDKKLPTQKEIENHLETIIRDEKPERIKEINDVYKNLNNMQYKYQETCFYYGKVLHMQLESFIDKKYPLNSVLFSNNKQLIEKAYSESVKRRCESKNDIHVGPPNEYNHDFIYLSVSAICDEK